ncbi:MAG TPA: hypothetical protein VJG49_00380 [Candidatus Nanoarchaeia archaeon]|nr:hypothetical protein [Candidatus Nanoarchaeia archaeon]
MSSFPILTNRKTIDSLFVENDLRVRAPFIVGIGTDFRKAVKDAREKIRSYGEMVSMMG